MSIKELANRYISARNSDDALRLGFNFNFGIRLFRRNDEENPKWKAETDADSFSVPLLDIASIAAVLLGGLLIYQGIAALIDLIRYKKRF